MKEPLQLKTKGGAQAWAYLSRSGKTLDVIVRPVTDDGEPILPTPVHVLIPLKKVKP